MSATVTGPFTLVAGATTKVAQPINTAMEAVVLTNLSPFILEVSIGSDIFWQSPFEEQIYDISDSNNANVVVAPTVLTGTTNPTGSASQINATWYTLGDKPDGDWPFSLAANALVAAISGSVFSTAIVAATTIANGGAPNTIAPNGSLSLNVAAYSEVALTLTGSNFALAFSGVLQQTANGLQCGTSYFQALQHPTGVNALVVQMTVQVLGDTLVIENYGVSTDNIVVNAVGSNRVTQGVTSPAGAGQFSSGVLGPFVAGSQIPLIAGLQTSKRVTWACAANFAGTLLYGAVDASGALMLVPIGNIPNTATFVTGECIVPIGLTSFFIENIPAITGANGLCILDVVGLQA